MRKKIKKRLFICLTLIMQLFCSMIGVQAETVKVEIDHYGFRWRIGFNAEFYDRYLEVTHPVSSERLFSISVNGVNAYCIEPNVEFYRHFNPTLYKDQDAIPIMHNAGYSDAEIRELSLISSLGYGYEGDFSDEMNAATQVRIWQIHFNDAISKIPSEIQKKIDVINERLRVMSTPMSFANQTIVLEGFGKDNAVVVEDTNNVLAEYLLNSVPNGVHVEIENNVCRIWLEETAELEGDILFDALYSAEEGNESMVAYAHPKNQTLASFEKAMPTQARVHYKYEEPMGSISVYKHGEKLVSAEQLNNDDLVQTKFEYKDEPIEGVYFNLQAKEDIKRFNGDILYKKGEVIQTLKTNEQGFAETLQLPYGEYLLQELKPAKGYVKDEKVYEVSIDKNGSHLEQKSILNQRQTVKMNVKKQSKSTKKPLKDCKFGIYTIEDIMVGSIIIPEDTLIESVLSDEDGNVTFQSDLPFGKYKIKEISCPDAYELSTDFIEIDMSKMESNQSVLSIKHLFENEFKKVSFFVEKVNEKNEKILNKSFEFGLYKDKDCTQLIQSKVSDSETSKIEFSDLDVGVYYVKEIKAPKGYERTNKVFKVNVTEEGKVLLSDKEIKKEDGVYVCSIMNKSTPIIHENEFKKMNFFIEKVNEKNEKILNKPFEFGLYKDKDCTQLIQSKVSDSETSKIEFSDLDVGVYYVKEIKAPEGYERTNKVFKVNVTKDGKILLDDKEIKKEDGVYVCSIMNKSTPIIHENEFKKMSFFIEKVNEKNEKILNKSFEFGLYKDKDCTQLIQSKVSDSETSKIEFSDLDVGVYYVKEIKAPEGYERTNKVFKVNVTKDGKILLDDEEIKKEDGVYVCSIMNKSISKLQTGYQSNRNLFFGLCLLSLMSGLCLKLRRNN